MEFNSYDSTRNKNKIKYLLCKIILPRKLHAPSRSYAYMYRKFIDGITYSWCLNIHGLYLFMVSEYAWPL